MSAADPLADLHVEVECPHCAAADRRMRAAEKQADRERQERKKVGRECARLRARLRDALDVARALDERCTALQNVLNDTMRGWLDSNAIADAIAVGATKGIRPDRRS